MRLTTFMAYATDKTNKDHLCLNMAKLFACRGFRDWLSPIFDYHLTISVSRPFWNPWKSRILR